MEWPRVRLGDVAQEFISGGTPSTKVEQYWTGDIPWITGADINDNIVVAGRKWITPEAIENSATHIVPKGSILLVTRTGVGKVAKAGADIAISQDLTGIVLKERTNADFVVAAIRQKMNSLLDIQQGAIIKGVLRKDVEKLEIPLPPLSEQRRIVELLDQADRLRQLRAKADAKAERILPALFIRMFGDPARNPMGWPTRPLSHLAEVVMGQSPLGDTYNDSGDGLPFFQGKADFGALFPTTRKWCSAPTRVAEAGDILLSVRAPVGPTNVACEKCCIGRGLVAIRANSTYANQGYLRLFFKQQEAVLSRQGQGSTFAAIKRNEVTELQIPLPPLSEQRLIAEVLDRADHLRRLRAEADAKLESLFDSLLHRAFFGDLTASWRKAHKKELL